MITTTRNANLADLLAVLQDQHARKLDIVVPATSIRSIDGLLHVTGAEQAITLDGVTRVDGVYRPTAVADEGIAARLDIPVGYLKRLRETRPDIYDANVNGWLHGRRGLVANPRPDSEGVYRWADGSAAERGEQRWKREPVAADPRSFMFRAFRGDDGREGIARALLSNRYNRVDNLDVLMATMQGIRDAGVHAEVRSADLTDRRMVVRISCPEVTAMAPALLAGYRSPFTGASGDENPTVFAGFKFTNSEVGGGAYAIVPEVIVQVCNNGMTMTVDALRKVHTGGRLEDGVVRWADDTQQKSLDLITAQTRDAVTTFLSAEYLNDAVSRLSEKAGQPVATVDAVRDITKPLGFTQESIDGILAYFVQGGQMTVGGVVNAITAYSQVVEDGDVAYDLDTRATELLLK